MAEPALKLNETAGDRWGLHEVEGSGLGEVVAGPRRVRTLTMVAIVLLAVLNAADVVTTRMVLDRTAGAAEANPLANYLLGSGTLLWVKLGIVALLGLAVLRRPRPRLGMLIGVWLATGVYLAVLLSNVLVLRLL